MKNTDRLTAQGNLIKLGLGFILAGVIGWVIIFWRWIPDPTMAVDNRWIGQNMVALMIFGGIIILLAYWRDLFPPKNPPPLEPKQE